MMQLQLVDGLLKEAKEGNAESQYNLALCYEDAHGVDRDLVEVAEPAP
jgi:TPR repeat protein